MSSQNKDRIEKIFRMFIYETDDKKPSDKEIGIIRDGIKSETIITIVKLIIGSILILSGIFLLIFNLSSDIFAASEVTFFSFSLKDVVSPIGVVLVIAGVVVIIKSNNHIEKKK